MTAYFYSRPDFELEPGVVLDGIVRKMRGGDSLVPPDASHVALSVKALKKLLRTLEQKGARFCPQYISGGPDELLELRFRADLKRAAVRRAKARGAYAKCTGRARTIDHDAVRRLKSAGASVDEIVAQMRRDGGRISRASVYGIVKQAA
jgi:hypothetical protein